jgi:hypothetical protein
MATITPVATTEKKERYRCFATNKMPYKVGMETEKQEIFRQRGRECFATNHSIGVEEKLD